MNREERMELLKNCLDEQGRLRVWPSKQARKEAAVRYLAEKFAFDRIYTEKEVNALIDQWHTFGDYFLLRRALVELGLLVRDRKGSQYQRAAQEEVREE